MLNKIVGSEVKMPVGVENGLVTNEDISVG